MQACHASKLAHKLFWGLPQELKWVTWKPFKCFNTTLKLYKIVYVSEDHKLD